MISIVKEIKFKILKIYKKKVNSKGGVVTWLT